MGYRNLRVFKDTSGLDMGKIWRMGLAYTSTLLPLHLALHNLSATDAWQWPMFALHPKKPEAAFKHVLAFRRRLRVTAQIPLPPPSSLDYALAWLRLRPPLPTNPEERVDKYYYLRDSERPDRRSFAGGADGELIRRLRVERLERVQVGVRVAAAMPGGVLQCPACPARLWRCLARRALRVLRLGASMEPLSCVEGAPACT